MEIALSGSYQLMSAEAAMRLRWNFKLKIYVGS
jgi:hypothetical protein